MEVCQYLIKDQHDWEFEVQPICDLVLVFGSRFLMEDKRLPAVIAHKFPNATLVACSTSGEISDENVYDNTITLTGISFKCSSIMAHCFNISDFEDTKEAASCLLQSLPIDNLKHILMLADGQLVNGSELTQALNQYLPTNIAVTGGLAGDAARFEKTIVGLNDNWRSGNLVAVGLYGDTLKIGYSSVGGWDSFGLDREITKSKGNVLYELDGKSALSLYKKYLGEELSKGLPANALRFPLLLGFKDRRRPLVRTILSVNEEEGSMVFAGDMPQGAYARLMRANHNRLIEGSYKAAEYAKQVADTDKIQLAILISCVGRKLVLNHRTEEEVEMVREVLGADTAITGFYSYGEIAPHNNDSAVKQCELHNQTMTITTISEL